ncbi:MAG: helix-turn-helix transcriptional regulator [Desulfobacterales bacterium]
MREFLREMPQMDRKIIGTDIKEVQFGWPLGMPLVRKMEMVDPHIGSDFDEFLKEEGIHEEVTAAAIKRVIAWQLEKLMKSKHITKTEMASRMRTSRAVVNRLLDEDDTSVTLATLARASLAIGVPLKIEFAINGGA